MNGFKEKREAGVFDVILLKLHCSKLYIGIILL